MLRSVQQSPGIRLASGRERLQLVHIIGDSQSDSAHGVGAAVVQLKGKVIRPHQKHGVVVLHMLVRARVPVVDSGPIL